MRLGDGLSIIVGQIVPEKADVSAVERRKRGCIFSREGHLGRECPGARGHAEEVAAFVWWVEQLSRRKVGVRWAQVYTLYLPLPLWRL